MRGQKAIYSGMITIKVAEQTSPFSDRFTECSTIGEAIALAEKNNGIILFVSRGGATLASYSAKE